MRHIADGSISRQNNFDFLRLMAAFFVLVSHQHALSGLPEPEIFRMSLGTFGVLIFFSVSGFLVSQSWRQDPSALRFAAKRFLRIWPGLAVVTLASAFLLGPAVSSLDPGAYFFHPALTDFLRTLKVVTIRYELPGVFEDNPHPRAVNGSLWTIPLEVRCYIVLLLLGCVGLMSRRWVILLGTIAAGVYYFRFAPDPKHYQLHFGLYFFAGVCLDLFRRAWEDRPLYLLGVAGGIALVCQLLGADRAALLLLIPAVSLAVGMRAWPVLSRAGRFGDLSYGIYIYAFPVQQTVQWAGGKDLPFAAGLAATAVLTVACAWTSWHLVEQPALGLKRHLSAWRSVTAGLRRSRPQ
ncbi:MAG TPA: acyltransferase [Noviherbaspirillum sp.]|uniref:acyltransferase family protein n=1 Tax=Noviherbaspirillum sp. TaxID=1926288 RepID=UPI002D39C7AF|nr:acyltransferase [Noviherbaspirillum sp.]HYD96356.1 acyltransferase [Noviherbaspirillum sp.]